MSYNRGHTIIEILLYIWFFTGNTPVISSTENIVDELSHQLLNDLGNNEKSQNWLEAQPSSYILSAIVRVKNCFACYLSQSLAKSSIFWSHLYCQTFNINIE